jgi:hypothetical protein
LHSSTNYQLWNRGIIAPSQSLRVPSDSHPALPWQEMSAAKQKNDFKKVVLCLVEAESSVRFFFYVDYTSSSISKVSALQGKGFHWPN